MSIKDTRVEKLLLFSSVLLCQSVSLLLWGFSVLLLLLLLLILYIQISSFCTSATWRRAAATATTAIFFNYGWLTKPGDKQTESRTLRLSDCTSEWAHSAELSSCLWSAYPQISDTWMCSTSDWPSGWRWARLASARLDWEQSSVEQRHRAQHSVRVSN